MMTMQSGASPEEVPELPALDFFRLMHRNAGCECGLLHRRRRNLSTAPRGRSG